MATLPPGAMDPNAGIGTDPNKILEQVAKDLGLLYKACAEADPSGQTAQAVGAMLSALGPLGQQIAAGGAGGAPGGEMAGPIDQAEGEYPIAPGAQGPMDQAGAQMAQMMGSQGPPTP